LATSSPPLQSLKNLHPHVLLGFGHDKLRCHGERVGTRSTSLDVEKGVHETPSRAVLVKSTQLSLLLRSLWSQNHRSSVLAYHVITETREEIPITSVCGTNGAKSSPGS
jgi:hypothetical protein